MWCVKGEQICNSTLAMSFPIIDNSTMCHSSSLGENKKKNYDRKNRYINKYGYLGLWCHFHWHLFFTFTQFSLPKFFFVVRSFLPYFLRYFVSMALVVNTLPAYALQSYLLLFYLLFLFSFFLLFLVLFWVDTYTRISLVNRSFLCIPHLLPLPR